MPIKATLTGDPIDLQVLAELFPSSNDPTVIAEQDGYYLTSESLTDDLIADGGPMREQALALLRLANGAARVASGGFRPVDLSGAFQNSTGHRSIVVVTGVAEERSLALPVTGVPNGTPPLRPSAPRYVELGAKHPDVKEALTILAQPEPRPTWMDLYKILEIVRDEIASHQPSKKARWRQVQSAGFAAPDDVQDVLVNACAPQATGDDARHARYAGAGPGRVLTLHQGREITRQVVICWLDAMP